MSLETHGHISRLIRLLVAEPDVFARSRLCDEWANAFMQLLIDRGVEPTQAQYTCAQVMMGAILAADTLLAEAARREGGQDGAPPPAVH